ncbi:hypothetical protein IV203_008878 [Nitzschia inconspicua]|uniref:Uncharacterized protein n=1 Tax=Nitzschia inconspicua TaxID=303405 RepID=A0A9K3L0X7_9STRA|nr:hypothetical protein IV203_008878 [Nitzschia inconspicua]
MTKVSAIALLFSALIALSNGFCPIRSSSTRSSTAVYDGDGTGGWGIGGQREMIPEEFARGDRTYFEGYKTKQQGDFMNQIQQEKEALKKSELEELLGVARIAGIDVKDPSKRLNKFEVDVMDDDDLDVSV